VRAVVINLKIYSRRHHINTAFEIIKRWTFGEAEDHIISNYAWDLARKLKASPEDKLNMEDPQVLLVLTRGIIKV